jgi:hypothetical protein
MENGRNARVAFIHRLRSSLQFVLTFGVEKLMGAVVIGFRHEDLGGAIEVAIVRHGRVHEILRGGDAMFFEHRHEHLGVDDGAGVKQFHLQILATDGRR